MIVDHHRVGRTIAKCQKFFESRSDRVDVRFNRLIGKHLADFVLARRVTNPRRSATHNHYRLVARLLQASQQHDRDKVADMKRWRGRVEAYIARHNLFGCQCVQRRSVGCLVNIATCIEQAEEVGFISSHSAPAPSMEFRHWPIFQ